MSIDLQEDSQPAFDFESAEIFVPILPLLF